ncbi:MAG: hypothetical protein AUG51_13580 [Acidobacteria bacterium 13_1_20CM_3_53_8]|nr:MAG: hypothetical protein AUG51_13580 [Acidobacteria bacterium 13_1_20CM_3_53_8]
MRTELEARASASASDDKFRGGFNLSTRSTERRRDAGEEDAETRGHGDAEIKDRESLQRFLSPRHRVPASLPSRVSSCRSMIVCGNMRRKKKISFQTKTKK